MPILNWKIADIDKKIMPEVISFNKKKNLIEVLSFGSLFLSEWLDDIQEIKRLNYQEDCNRVLVDITKLVSVPSMVNIFETASEKLPRNMRFALIMEAGQNIREDVHFFETVSLNRGISVQLFNRREEASDWFKG